MPKNLLILKFLYGRDRPSGFLASKELPGAEQKLPGQDKFLSALPRPPAGPYAVEKTPSPEIRRNKIGPGSPTNDVLGFLDIFYPPNFACLGRKGSFSTAQAITLKTPSVGSMSLMAILRQLEARSFSALCRCPRVAGTRGRVTEHGLLQLRIHFVSDGDHVQEHFAEIHFGEIVL